MNATVASVLLEPAISWWCGRRGVGVQGGGGSREEEGGASGVAGRLPMDLHFPAGPRADGGRWEDVVHTG